MGVLYPGLLCERTRSIIVEVWLYMQFALVGVLPPKQLCYGTCGCMRVRFVFVGALYVYINLMTSIPTSTTHTRCTPLTCSALDQLSAQAACPTARAGRLPHSISQSHCRGMQQLRGGWTQSPTAGSRSAGCGLEIMCEKVGGNSLKAYDPTATCKMQRAKNEPYG